MTGETEVAEAIKAGDVVQLVSGGSLMTVERVEGTRAYCVWFNEDDQLNRDSFELATLAHPDEEEEEEEEEEAS
jgi:uncharacterized protein YodC (DUF2158 family)